MNDDSQDVAVELIQQVVSIVSAYVSHNAMRAGELPEFIGAVHSSIRQLSQDKGVAESKPPESPAVPVKRSVNKDFIICLECGKKFKSLRRHLSSFHNLTPDEYRAKWSLPSDYPMVAPAYSATRSQLARDSGLGQISRTAAVARAADHEEVAEAASPSGGAATKGGHEAGTSEDAAPVEAPAAELPAVAEAAPAAASSADEPAKPKRGRPRKAA